MKKLLSIITILTATILSNPSHSKDLTIRVSGSTTVEYNLFKPFLATLEETTGNKIFVNGNGSSRGIIDLFAGKSSMAMISAPLEDVLNKIDIHADSLEVANLTVYKIGTTNIQFGTNLSNTVAIMSKKEIKQALSGYKTSWKDFGGKDEDITVVTEYIGGGFRTVVEKKLLLGAEFSDAIIEEKTGKDIIKSAQKTKGALVVATEKILSKTDGIRPIITDFKLEQPLFIVTKGKATKDQMKIIEKAKELLR